MPHDNLGSWTSPVTSRAEALADNRSCEAALIAPLVADLVALRKKLAETCRTLRQDDAQCGVADADGCLENALSTLRSTIKDLNDGQADELLNALAPEDVS